MEIYVKLAISLTVQGMKNFQFQVASPLTRLSVPPILIMDLYNSLHLKQ